MGPIFKLNSLSLTVFLLFFVTFSSSAQDTVPQAPKSTEGVQPAPADPKSPTGNIPENASPKPSGAQSGTANNGSSKENEDEETKKITKKDIKSAEEDGEVIKFERQVNFLAAAGVSFRISPTYTVAVSPIDKTVHFEKNSPAFSSLTTGLVWNPITRPYKVTYFKEKSKEWRYEYKTLPPCFALLINVFNLSLSGAQMNSTLPIDVGFGVGLRKNGLCVLLTMEFTPLRQPQKYFYDEFTASNKQLIYAGSTEPITEISTDNDNLFSTKLVPAFGFKVAYAFTAPSKEK